LRVDPSLSPCTHPPFFIHFGQDSHALSGCTRRMIHLPRDDQAGLSHRTHPTAVSFRSSVYCAWARMWPFTDPWYKQSLDSVLTVRRGGHAIVGWAYAFYGYAASVLTWPSATRTLMLVWLAAGDSWSPVWLASLLGVWSSSY
jgi:hypothetical protein